MTHVSSFNRSFNPLGAARRHHKKRNGRPLVAGSKVVANGKLRVELSTVDGGTVAYIAVPTMIWRFTPDTSVRPKVHVLTPEEEEAPLTIEEEAEALAVEELKLLWSTTPVDSIKRAVSAARALCATRALSATHALSATLDEFVNRARAAAPATSPAAPTILNIAAE